MFGFGVVLLELMTGLRALDTNRPSGQHVLVEWARPSLTEKKKLKKIMDKGLGEEYPIKGAMQAAELILKCLESDPKNRPSMEDVLEILVKINDIKLNIKGKNDRSNNKSKEESSSSYQHHGSPIPHRHGANGRATTSSAQQRPLHKK